MSTKSKKKKVNWGERVYRLREKKDWSQVQLAEALGCALGSVWNWEQGRTVSPSYQAKLNTLGRRYNLW